MSARRAWVLNLDVEHELEDPKGYTRSRAMHEQLRTAADKLRASGFLGATDLVLAPDVPVEVPADVQAATWCPTPRALARLAEAGLEAPEAPALEVLQRVNDRRFAVELDRGPLESVYATTRGQVLERIASGSGPWLLKRALSFAGRGHRRILEPPDAALERWLENSFRRGRGVVVEPLVERDLDVSVHAELDANGTLRLEDPQIARCDARGNWLGSRPARSGELRPHELDALEKTARRAGQALNAAGYFGPFGLDGFRYRKDGELRFNPMCELNARYVMGWRRP